MGKWLYASVPVVVAGAGALYTTLRPPSDKLVSAIQHFAAGVILYAVAGELLPDTARHGLAGAAAVGGALGIAAVLALPRVAKRASGPAGLLGAAGIDALIDGLVLGLGFNVGAHQGRLLAIALAIEFLFLGLSISTVLPKGLAQPYETAASAFGLIAVLYLVTEELLVEAHENPETLWGTALLFVGFLLMLVIDELVGK